MNRYPTPCELRSIVDYDPDTGLFTWRWRPLYDFPDKRTWMKRNSQYSGKAAGFLNRHGYLNLCVMGKTIGAHRLAWLYYYGTIPSVIDHINGIRTDNRIANLREVSVGENSRNQKIRSTNKSGVTGVMASGSKFRAYIGVSGKFKTLGTFDDFDAAIYARKKAESDHGYHPNHGRDGQ